MESANFSANEKNADFPPTGKGMNRKTAGAERRRNKPERIPTQSGGSEG